MPDLRPTRRAVLLSFAVAGGLAIGFRDDAAEAQRNRRRGRRPPRKPAAARELGVWLVVTEDDRVIVRVARAEMGQGTMTGLAQLAAEELDCDWAQVRVDLVEPGESLRRGKAWGDFNTSNSRSIQTVGPLMREAGATARSMLLSAAATAWSVPRDELIAEAGKIVHRATSRTATFGQLAEAASRLPIPLRESLTLKPVSAWKIAGQGLRSLGARGKVTGRAVYGIDVRLPGLLTAAIRAAPVAGGKLASFEASAAEAMSAASCRSATVPSPWSPTAGGRRGARSTRSRSSGPAPSIRASATRASRPISRPALPPTTPSSAGRTAMRWRRCGRPPRRSRRSTPHRSCTTPRWNR
jgi:isoquinoline 1-oxidoreductase beta subunit